MTRDSTKMNTITCKQCGEEIEVSEALQGQIEAQVLASEHKRHQAELAKVIVGQQRVIDELLIAIFARGHCLMQGVPGLAKTLLVSTLARAMDLSFHRIQFTPDLMPSDITGTDILQEDPEGGRRRRSALRQRFSCLRGWASALSLRRNLPRLAITALVAEMRAFLVALMDADTRPET